MTTTRSLLQPLRRYYHGNMNCNLKTIMQYLILCVLVLYYEYTVAKSDSRLPPSIERPSMSISAKELKNETPQPQPQRTVNHQKVTSSADNDEASHSKEEDDGGCRGKQRIIDILRAANVTYMPQCVDLPSWDQIVRLYGEKPVILGLDTCAAYREKMQRSSDQKLLVAMKNNHSLERIAGIYNSGTNAMAHFLNLNLKTYENYKQRNVPWGKQ